MGIFSRGGKKFDEWKQATHTKEQKDWTHFLSADAAQTLRSLLEDAYHHRQAYFKAGDIKNAQIWSALIEMKKQVDELTKIVGTMPRATTAFKLGTADDSEVLNRIRAQLQPTMQDSKGATDALVNSLLKF